MLRALLVPLLLLQVGGCNDGGESLGLSKITVNGRVADLNGLPLPGVSVTIIGRPAVESDANGEFTVSDVAIPYDVVLTGEVLSPTPHAVLTVYEGLSRSDPILTALGYQANGTPPHGAELGGMVEGALFAPLQPDGYQTLVDFESPQVPYSGTQPIRSGASGAFSFQASWRGPAVTVGTIHALQMQMGEDGQPVNFSGYGARSGVALSDGASVSGQDVTLAAIQVTSVDGTLSVPPGATVTGIAVSLDFGNGCYEGMYLANIPHPIAPGFAAVTPVIPGAAICAAAAADFGDAGYTVAGRRGLPGTSGLDLVFPPPPAHRTPADGATGVTTTTVFSWSEFAGGVYALYVTVGATSFVVLTSRTSVTIPDLRDMGRGVPGASQGRWCISGVAPMASTDELAGRPGTVWSMDVGRAVDGAIGWGGCRTFTTAP
jgi:hypothetical protein